MSDELRPPVELDFQLDRHETASALRWHVLHQTGFRWKAMIGVVSSGLLSVSFHLTGWSWTLASMFGAGVFAVGVLLVAFVFPYVVVAQTPQLTQSYKIVVSHRGLRYETDNSRGHIEWERYDAWKASGDCFFLYYDGDQFTLIPRDRLPDPQYNRLRAFFTDYIGSRSS